VQATLKVGTGGTDILQGAVVTVTASRLHEIVNKEGLAIHSGQL
jgi:hypothetical protein